MGITVDSSILIDVLHGERRAAAKLKEIDARTTVNILCTPVLYEVAAGLAFSGSRTQLAAFQAIASRFLIASFDEASARRAAEIEAELMRVGGVNAPVDIMIAGMAAAGSHILVTADKSLQRIGPLVGFQVEGY